MFFCRETKNTKTVSGASVFCNRLFGGSFGGHLLLFCSVMCGVCFVVVLPLVLAVLFFLLKLLDMFMFCHAKMGQIQGKTQCTMRWVPVGLNKKRGKEGFQNIYVLCQVVNNYMLLFSLQFRLLHVLFFGSVSNPQTK